MRWPPYQHIFFDCDSTLTTVEGIDILAQSSGKGWRVEVLTRAAMDGDIDLEDVYSKRLNAVKPTWAQIHNIRQVYKRNVVEDAAAVIAILQEQGHKVYIVSGGLAQPVIEFGLYLGVPREQIRAVEVHYDQLSGSWWHKSHASDAQRRYLAHAESDLTVSDGKARIMRELVGDQPGQSLLVGDGLSDLVAGRHADLFVGFCGVVRRPRIVAEAPALIHSSSMAPLLALAMGPAGLRRLESTAHRELVQKTNHLIETGAITFNNERLNTKFTNAYQAVYSGSH